MNTPVPPLSATNNPPQFQQKNQPNKSLPPDQQPQSSFSGPQNVNFPSTSTFMNGKVSHRYFRYFHIL